MKTGGRADVSGALTAALHTQGLDINKLLLPSYREVWDKCRHTNIFAILPNSFGPWDIRIIESKLPGTT